MKKRSRHLKEVEIIDIVKMIKNGASVAEVASAYNVSLVTINNHLTKLRKLGVELPKKPRAPRHVDKINHQKIADLLKYLV